MFQLYKVLVFGNSIVVINWMSGKFKMEDLLLSIVFEQIKRMEHVFNRLSFIKIYRELNIVADIGS